MQSSPSGSPVPATAEEAVMTAMVSVVRRMRQRLPGEQLDFAALPLLKTLLHSGPMRITALAAELGLDASTVSRHARNLEQEELLERTGDPEDGRASQVRLSDHGKSCLEQGAARRRAVIAKALEHWSEQDREQLRLLLIRLHTDLNTSQHSQENS